MILCDNIFETTVFMTPITGLLETLISPRTCSFIRYKWGAGGVGRRYHGYRFETPFKVCTQFNSWKTNLHARVAAYGKRRVRGLMTNTNCTRAQLWLCYEYPVSYDSCTLTAGSQLNQPVVHDGCTVYGELALSVKVHASRSTRLNQYSVVN